MNTIDFHKTITDEILAIKDRVRKLINHWGEDGRYKEAVLKSIILKFLPEKYRIASGFVIKQTANRGTHEPSKQIDLIIYDTAFPVLFKENDFVILTADAVVGIIEVKANVVNQNLTEVIKKCNNIGKFIFDGRFNKEKKFFNGIFSYDSIINNEDLLVEKIKNGYEEFLQYEDYYRYCVNHITPNKDYFYKFWEQELTLELEPNYIYKIENLAFSFFISNLIDWLSENSVIENSNIWFPTDKTNLTKKKF